MSSPLVTAVASVFTKDMAALMSSYQIKQMTMHLQPDFRVSLCPLYVDCFTYSMGLPIVPFVTYAMVGGRSRRYQGNRAAVMLESTEHHTHKWTTYEVSRSISS
jgi:hypothetical protein